ncbi:hypothetical protein EX895_003468 [Sporisorium graminicola]|uniref:Uncharacterized protein n=1 Tax=Sporisorium graminicola TaxID=280036 RepID=A0A4U7KSH4_9BASI|nr:hypothetical protein EX895_003468 [Sporisorium graminicola]TKY87454.1 hypothetical protein EX895_003468 [Sporisorium graminicola]
MQPRRMLKMPLKRRQVNPAAFSGVTDQISNIGTSAGNKAAHATSGLSRTQTFVVAIMCIVGFALAVAALFWLCSLSRRRKRVREMQEKSQRLKEMSSSSTEAAVVAGGGSVPKRASRQLGAYNNDGWGESRIALNSSFVSSNNERYAWDKDEPQRGQVDTPVDSATHESHSVFRLRSAIIAV